MAQPRCIERLPHPVGDLLPSVLDKVAEGSAQDSDGFYNERHEVVPLAKDCVTMAFAALGCPCGRAGSSGALEVVGVSERVDASDVLHQHSFSA